MRTAIIVWDGLRPEFINCGLTPAVCALQDHGVTFSNHSAVFPTETRVNSSSIATGCYPGRHGIVANRFWSRSRKKMINTGDHTDLARLNDGPDGILAVPTLCELLADAGKRTIIVGSGSPGSTFLQAPTRPDKIVNVRGFAWPEEESARIVDQYGDFPGESDPPDAWNDLACRIFGDAAQSGLYDVGVLWLCDPDFTQHKWGLGSGKSRSAIRKNDGRLARLYRSMPDGVDLILASDHGFSTVGSTPEDLWLDLPTERAWFGSSGIYLADVDRDLEAAVAGLLSQAWAGPVFTRDSGDGQFGIVEGTFSKTLLRIDHDDRSPDIVYSRRWTQDVNVNGVEGMVYGAGGIATHGSLSPHDRRGVLLAAGPSFRSGLRIESPTAAVDIAPSVLRTYGLDSGVDGRVLVEGLSGGGDAEAPAEESRRVENIRGQSLTFTRVNETEYLDSVTC